MSTSEFDEAEKTRLRELSQRDGAAAHRKSAIERMRRAAHTPIGMAAIAGSVALIASYAFFPRIGGHEAAHEAAHRPIAATESLTMRRAISRAIDPTMTSIAQAALKIHATHPGSVYDKKPDGKGGGIVEIADWTSNGSGTVTSIDVVMGLKNDRPDTSNVLFADVEAPSLDQSAAISGNSDEVWFAEAGGKKYAEETASDLTADAQNLQWSVPAVYSQNYLGPDHGVITDTTSQEGLATGDSGNTLSAAATAAQIAQLFTPPILEKVTFTLK